MQGKPEQSKILDSTPWIPDHICNLSGIPDSFSCIPDSKAQGSEFHQLKFPWIPLHGERPIKLDFPPTPP